ncbi:MAG TPA: MFS transporter [Ktedonobacteraceae bacterium]|nr:MFS transporter [Ktedonobacteraceae bacterium]
MNSSIRNDNKEHVETTRENAARFAQLQIGLAFFSFILIGANDGAFGVLIPSLQTHYGINKATVGLLFLMQTVGYLIAAFNTGLLVEKLGNRRFLLLGALSFLVGALALALMLPFDIVLVTMLLLGFGIAIIDAGLNAYIASLPRNAALLNYLHAFYGTGALLGPLVASTILAIRWGWNSVYFIWIGICLLLLIGFRVIFEKGQNNQSSDETDRPQGNILVITLKQPIVWIAALFLLVYVGAEISVGNWVYSLLTEERHFSILFSGWLVSGYWLGLTLGRVALARVALRIGSERLIQCCLGGAIVAALIFWLVPLYAVSAFGLCLLGFSFGPIYPITISFLSSHVSQRVLPGAVGFLASLGSIGGALFPSFAGILAQRVGLWSLMPLAILLALVMFCLWQLLQVRASV